MSKNWIRESGTVTEAELRQLLETFAAGKETLSLAAWPDRYEASHGLPVTERLLEIRAVCGEAELWAHRSAIGQPFVWRIADDAALRAAVGAKLDEYRMEQCQKLDIDSTKSKGSSLVTTGGRRYSLPISDENAVRLALYIDYDENGTAAIADFRVMGFERKTDFD